MPISATLPVLGFTPPAYPTLASKPQLPIQQKYVDATIRSAPTEIGYEITRARNNRTRREWTVKYDLMTAADFALLEDFAMNTVQMGAEIFTWTHPATGVTYNVRFSAAPESGTTWVKLTVGYQVAFTLREV